MRLRGFRSGIITGLVVLTASRLIAETDQAVPLPKDPLATARRDFEAIQNGKGAPAPSDLLRFQGNVPLVDTTADAPVPLSPIQRARKLEALKEKSKAAASSHWLLDAMGVQTPAAEADASPAVSSDGLREKIDSRVNGAGNLAERSRTLRSNSPHSAPAPRVSDSLATAPPNPLQQYMAGWLAPRDLQLLRSAAASSVTKSDGTVGASASLGLLTGDFAPNTIAGAFSPQTATRSAMTPSNPSNPYLSDAGANFLTSAPSMESPLSVAAPRPPSPSTTPVISVPDLPPISEAKPTEAEKLKRTEDGKYFRQLKRF